MYDVRTTGQENDCELIPTVKRKLDIPHVVVPSVFWRLHLYV